MARLSSSTGWKRMLAACAILGVALLLTACGNDSTTVTSTG